MHCISCITRNRIKLINSQLKFAHLFVEFSERNLGKTPGYFFLTYISSIPQREKCYWNIGSICYFIGLQVLFFNLYYCICPRCGAEEFNMQLNMRKHVFTNLPPSFLPDNFPWALSVVTANLTLIRNCRSLKHVYREWFLSFWPSQFSAFARYSCNFLKEKVFIEWFTMYFVLFTFQLLKIEIEKEYNSKSFLQSVHVICNRLCMGKYVQYLNQIL